MRSKTITGSLEEAPKVATPNDGLRGNLGIPSLLFTVIAFNGPMIVLLGLVAVIVSSGNGLAAPLTFLFVGSLVLVFAVGLNAMATRMTQPGAFYTYVVAGLGRPLGLAAGLLAILTYVTLGSGTYAYFAVGIQKLGTSLIGSEIAPWWVFALLGWVLVTVLSLFNIEISAKVLGVLSLVELAVVLIWNVAVNVNGGPESRTFDAGSAIFSGSPALALVFAALCLTGFESLQVFRSETRNPSKTVPRATYISVIGLTVLYSLCAYSYIIGFGPSQAVAAGADPTAALLSSITTYLNSTFADLANVLFVTSTFASCLAIQNILARYVFAFGRDGILPARLGKAHAKQGSPMAAAAVVGGVVLLVFIAPAIANFTPLATYVTLSGIGAYVLIGLWFLTSISVIAYFSVRRGSASVWRVIVAPAAACLGLGTVVVFATINFESIVGLSGEGSMLLLLVVAVVAALGVVIALWLRRKRPAVYQTIGNQKLATDAADEAHLNEPSRVNN
ncbi:APC family permease [Agreia sp. VKM Ac-1783]|uniref:APC family permease n=1 Tax=Agreia sp. VKM Ac-1783 TaxID=1938889 RepID=UPI000A2AD11E|nr:APC family permease [Agreia sp. VKM Ac-1783]SMQ74215.1 amino acid/polyamine/organocation transporter, APC superfamily [Agreia sp. VKM Ac-1783]